MRSSPTDVDSAFLTELEAELNRAVIGQRALLKGLIIGLLADGHVLLEGVPGLAKTLAARALSAAIDCTFRRVQFTPDLLPADVIGTMVYHQRTGEFTVQRGPIFTQLLLADEINRAPAKVQSALLEAMQEKQVTIGGVTFPLDEPFLVLATQNPIEHEGTYPLPEAQVDRFLLKLLVTYPARDDEAEMLDSLTSGSVPTIRPMVNAARILQARRAVDAIALDPKARDYALDIIRATREKNPLVEYGASPRAAIGLVRAAKANAFMEGRGWVAPEDIKAVAPDVLRHRVILTYEADAERVTADDVIKRILDTHRVP